MTHKLADFLRAATQPERARCAAMAGTSESYLYQVAGKHRKNPGVTIAVGIEKATRMLHKETKGRTPIVTVEDLADIAKEQTAAA